jgi:Trm5-related predicted tRNA methylase
VTYSGWGLVGENIALLAKNFVSHGFNVVINGYLDVESWQEIEKRLDIDSKVLLLPDAEINIDRDAKRNEDVKMGEQAVREGRKYFNTTSYYQDFIKIDSTNHTVEETYVEIAKLLE